MMSRSTTQTRAVDPGPSSSRSQMDSRTHTRWAGPAPASVFHDPVSRNGRIVPAPLIASLETNPRVQVFFHTAVLAVGKALIPERSNLA